MMTSFLDGISGGTGEKVAGDWLQHFFSPAFFFWGGALWLVSFTSWVNPLDFFLAAELKQQILLGLAFVGVVILSDILSEWVTLPILKRLEGYYWPASLEKHGIMRWRRILEEKDDRLARLNPNLAGQDKERIRLDAELALLPEYKNMMPTYLGNLLRAAEAYSMTRYGLDAIIVWPHLWQLLPEPAQQELRSIRRQLDRAVQLLAWGLLFWIWTYFTWWAAPIVFITLPMAYYRIIQCATQYPTLIRTAFDLHRFALYEQMRWPLPPKIEDEVAMGKELTQYIWRGFTSLDVAFAHS